ncbi:hypothetical protein IscW_ISCW012425 [Ixodes scapularis]|uniref:Uncharacterized protein n=1 Tax=Ixodes scapularis TaxID=6945 RepID=B7QCF1_IXOSC|nr:hypothetical protein IscW_ISCW012425 [Ixodes scapularis]|eukprot:XP_002413215.1 hypothetical protein IscW_ISCW012425 [Ixodes scapularis]
MGPEKVAEGLPLGRFAGRTAAAIFCLDNPSSAMSSPCERETSLASLERRGGRFRWLFKSRRSCATSC